MKERKHKSPNHNRRRFLKNSAQTGAAAAISAILVRPSPAASKPAAFELEEITIAGLQDAMKSGRHTAQAIAECTWRALMKLTATGRRSIQ